MGQENKFRGGMMFYGYFSTTWPFIHLTVDENSLRFFDELVRKNYIIDREKIIKITYGFWGGLYIYYQGDKYKEQIRFSVMPVNFKRLKNQLAKYNYI